MKPDEVSSLYRIQMATLKRFWGLSFLTPHVYEAVFFAANTYIGGREDAAMQIEEPFVKHGETLRIFSERATDYDGRSRHGVPQSGIHKRVRRGRFRISDIRFCITRWRWKQEDLRGITLPFFS
jgi:hypothetical protein